MRPGPLCAPGAGDHVGLLVAAPVAGRGGDWSPAGAGRHGDDGWAAQDLWTPPVEDRGGDLAAGHSITAVDAMVTPTAGGSSPSSCRCPWPALPGRCCG